MTKGPTTGDSHSKKSKKESDGKTDPHVVEPKRPKMVETAQGKVLLPSVSTGPVVGVAISENDIFAAEWLRIQEERASSYPIIRDIRNVGSIDSLLYEKVSKQEKLNIYVNLLRFLGTIDEAKECLSKLKKDAALSLLAKMQSIAYFLGEEDVNILLLSLMNNRIQEIGKEIIKVLPNADIPNFQKMIDDSKGLFQKQPPKPK